MAQDIRTNMGAGAASPMENESATGLLSRLVNDVSALFRNEVALAKAEFADAAGKAKAGIASMATGGAVLLAGLLSLVAAAILALAEVLAPWLSALIVGGLLSVVGFVMISAGKKKIEPAAFKLERTQESLRRDGDVVARRT